MEKLPCERIGTAASSFLEVGLVQRATKTPPANNNQKSWIVSYRMFKDIFFFLYLGNIFRFLITVNED